MPAHRRLTPDQAAMIRELRADGLSMAEVARRVGCSPDTVCRAEKPDAEVGGVPKWALLPPATRRLMWALIGQRCGDREIGELLGVYARAVRWWRMHGAAD